MQLFCINRKLGTKHFSEKKYILSIQHPKNRGNDIADNLSTLITHGLIRKVNHVQAPNSNVVGEI